MSRPLLYACLAALAALRASTTTSGCPTATSAIIDGGHFIWEEAPAEYAAIVLDSILRGLKPRA